VRVEVLDHLLEDFAIAHHRCLVLVNPQIEIALFLFAVATEAILAEQGSDLTLEQGVAAAGFWGGSGAQDSRSPRQTQNHQTNQHARALGHDFMVDDSLTGFIANFFKKIK